MTRSEKPRSGGPARPRLANPYDLGTWASAAARPAEDPVPSESTRESSRPRGGDRSPSRSEPAPVAQRVDVREPAPDAEDGVLFDPPELAAAADPFELARRTVNRSRAAARDRGLFPISAKTQARDVRDRSGRAPGYSGSRPDPRDPQGIDSVLKKVLGSLGWHAGMNAGRVLEEWDDIVGERIAQHCRPVSFEEGVLVVSASSSAWAAQLRMLTPQLITTIEERVGSHVISELTVTGPAAAERTWKKGRRTVTWRGPRDTYG
ncbi:RNA-binding protein [Brachybacterium ginsengisoli]|uniref:RNA-binding protein n=1 Tax=Brachybacterium ginsengisoli TaxID=1331682 RepID=A0A291H1L8_9MICO|nr:DciA family protein [Brachybacterium ginsengisoli]ATG56371.1 RNA-binding protein [Brachybacterium ginsengisoli]